MPINFQLSERPLGWAKHAATPNELVAVDNAGVYGPDEAQAVQDYLQRLQSNILRHIPDLPAPEKLGHIVVILHHDLTGVAYANELDFTAKVQTARPVEKGAAATVDDMAAIEEVTLSIAVPEDAAVVVILTAEWRRAVYFDFGPVALEPKPRIGSLERILAAQVAMLWGVGKKAPIPERTTVDEMAEGYQQLRKLLSEQCESEAAYHELLRAHPWMFGLGVYSKFESHIAFDDKNVPDFTLRRTADNNDDFVELKQPFLKFFTTADEPSAVFQNAWHQAERYLTFAHENRDYLRNEKKHQRGESALLASAWHAMDGLAGQADTD